LLANPAAGWQVNGWFGIDNDSRKGLTNALTMPAAIHTVTVRYEPINE
jgi:hypothetical protein